MSSRTQDRSTAADRAVITSNFVGPTGGLIPSVSDSASASPTDADGHDESARSALREFYERNSGLILVFAAQTFGSVMNAAAKLLTSHDADNAFSALHIIFVRMLATAILGTLYQWYKKVPDFPLGPRPILGLLLLRGLCGFFGLFGLYYSLSVLDISDATAITFLVPTWTAILCYVWLKEPYRMQEALAGLISLAGVLLIARPGFIFGTNSRVGSPSSPRRAGAVACSILGTFAAAAAYSTIRRIGARAHSLISVNYFAAMSTMGSAVSIGVDPNLSFMLPRGATQWVLLVIIGVAGFLLQFLLTEGLQREKGGRATHMTYFQMIFALVLERVIWGTTPPLLSLVGSALIIGAAIWLSLQKSKAPRPKVALVDEEASLLRPSGSQET